MHLAEYYVTHPGIVEARKLMEFFARYHECRQIGSVNGKEDHSKHGPDVGHESRSLRKRKVQTSIIIIKLFHRVCQITVQSETSKIFHTS